MNLDTYEERIDYFINILPKIDMSKKHITDLCVAFYGRLTALIKYKSTDNKFKSKVTLFKAKCPSFINVADDYGLSKICYGDVEKFSIEGNHVTILEKDDLAAEINRIISEK